MIQIFEELGFVSITEGVMTVNKEAEEKEIDSSHISTKTLSAWSRNKNSWLWAPCSEILWLFDGSWLKIVQVISLKSECLGPMAQHVGKRKVSALELTEEETIKNNQLNPCPQYDGL